MKQTFPLTHPRHAPARVVEGIKFKVRKYFKRSRRKELPEDVDFWDFDCRTGRSEEAAEKCHEKELIGMIDAAVAATWQEIYIEILAKPGFRTKRPVPEAAPAEEVEPISESPAPESPGSESTSS